MSKEQNSDALATYSTPLRCPGESSRACLEEVTHVLLWTNRDGAECAVPSCARHLAVRQAELVQAEHQVVQLTNDNLAAYTTLFQETRRRAEKRRSSQAQRLSEGVQRLNKLHTVITLKLLEASYPLSAGSPAPVSIKEVLSQQFTLLSDVIFEVEQDLEQVDWKSER